MNRLEPIGNTLEEEYPYRDWEDLYRKEWTWDKVGHAAHCINCVGNCAFEVFVKDGIVLREEQLAKYPQINPNVPDANPRGCQKGSIHSAAMYEGDRLRYPLKRVGERGEGKWQRMSWDDITVEIADKVIDIYEKYGAGKLMTHTGSGNQSMVRLAAPYRFASLVGGVQLDIFTDVGDLNTGAHLAYGNPLESFTSDAWFDADYIMLSLFNPNATRIPDAHYIWEAKYNGARVVSVAPDYNPSSIHCDLWMPIKQGADPFLAMSMVNTIIEEKLYKEDFMKEQTDLPMLVRIDNGKLLREADLQDGGSDQVFYHWDLNTGAVVQAVGSMGSEEKTIALNGVDPALEGQFEVNGIAVSTVFEQVKKEAAKYPAESTQEDTGLHPDMVRGEARAFAKAKKAIMMTGFNIGRYSNGIYTGWGQVLMLALTGHGGRAGGMDTSWVEWNHAELLKLALYDFEKLPRLEAGGLGEFMRGGMLEHSRRHYDDDKLKSITGFNLDEMEEMIHESIDKGWMPYHGDMKGLISIADNKFRRNKFADKYRARILEEELFVDVNVRMDSTAQWADYLLPAASHHGEQSHWMLITLASMLGQIGLPGGGYGLSYHYSSGGAPTHTTPILKAINDASGQAVDGAAWLASSGAVSIPVSRFVETLLNPGKTMQFNGHEIELPKIKMAYWVGGNPFSHQQDRNEMLRAWRELDTFIVHDVQWTASARHADIVLPATTSYERNDIEQLGDYALSHIVAMKKIVEPVFEARNDIDIFADIAKKLGKGYEFTQGQSELDWIRSFYESAKIESRAKGMEMPVFDVFWESNKPLAFPVSGVQKDFVRHADFRADPLLNALGTASGKFELYSRAIEKYGYDDCPPHATWIEPIERLAGPTTQYPLHLAANHPQMRLHSQLCGTVNRESYQIGGREPCWMNPKDAASRGLKVGDVVRVFNDRGQLLAGLKITDEIMEGVIRINEGGWFDPQNPGEIGSLCVYGDVNMLTTGVSTSKLAQGNCGHTGVVEVERFEGPLPPVRVFSQPA